MIQRSLVIAAVVSLVAFGASHVWPTKSSKEGTLDRAVTASPEQTAQLLKTLTEDHAEVADCDPGAQTGCPQGQKCDLFCNGSIGALGCRDDRGRGEVAEACDNVNRCQKGTACLGLKGGAQCTKFCSSDTDCGAGTLCKPAAIALSCGAGRGEPITVAVCQ